MLRQNSADDVAFSERTMTPGALGQLAAAVQPVRRPCEAVQQGSTREGCDDGGSTARQYNNAVQQIAMRTVAVQHGNTRDSGENDGRTARQYNVYHEDGGSTAR
jgi:hypothetical protein